MRKLLGLALAAAVLSAAPARAQQNSGLSLGLRLGIGFPMGKADGLAANDISYGVPTKIPIWFEAGYRFDRSWYLGAYFQWGPAQTKNCPQGETCSASDQRLGVNVHYRFDSGGGFVPWLGAGLGYEWLNLKEEAGGLTATADASGFEFLNLQVGGDFRVSPTFAVGPYLCFSLAQFSSESVSLPGQPTVSVSVSDKTTHEWFQLGVKGTFDL